MSLLYKSKQSLNDNTMNVPLVVVDDRSVMGGLTRCHRQWLLGRCDRVPRSFGATIYTGVHMSMFTITYAGAGAEQLSEKKRTAELEDL